MNAIRHAPRSGTTGAPILPAKWRRAPWLGRALLLALAPLVTACARPGSDRSEARLTPIEFVEIVTALREAERAVAQEDSAPALFDARKSEILAEHGATESQIRAFLAAHRTDVALMERVWDAIAQRLKHVPAGSDVEQRSFPTPGRSRPGPGPALPLPVPLDTGEQRLH